MNINEAIKHLGWKFKNHWSPTPTDLDAYNSIIDFRDTQFSINLTENEPLAKLFIVYFIMLCKRHNLTSKEALNSIDDILKQDLHTWIKVLQNQIKVMHIGTIGAKKYPLDLNEYNITKLDERNQQIINDFQPELLKALKTELKEDDVIKWVEDIITGITNK